MRWQRDDAAETVARLITVRALPGAVHRGLLSFAGRQVPCALGRSGITRRKREGDGATPAGRFRLLSVLYRPDRVGRPRTGLPVVALSPSDGWCDDPADANYNQPVGLPYGGRAERLWRDDDLYDVIVVLDYNIAPRRRGAGSAIFFHIARPDFAPTEGCVAVRLADMRHILAAVGIGATMVID